MNAKRIISIIILVLFLIFIFQNSTSITVRFLLYQVKMPTVILLVFIFALGVLTGIFVPYTFKKKRK
jgi:uncharacterized integral membrane protein